MPEQKITYQERVDNMAKSINAAATGYAPYKEVVGNFYVRSAAKEAVYRQAEAIILREWGTIEKYNDWLKNNNPAALNTKKYLLEHGYIEPKTEEDASPSN